MKKKKIEDITTIRVHWDTKMQIRSLKLPRESDEAVIRRVIVDHKRSRK